jgi:hypothetical protein
LFTHHSSNFKSLNSFLFPWVLLISPLQILLS